MANLSATNWLAGSETQGLAGKEMALVLSGDGKVCTVLHSSVDIEPNESIDAIWSATVCTRIRDNLRRVLRDRRFFSEELNLDD